MASLLKSEHVVSSSFESKPIYDYTSLKKGVTCGRCNGFMVVCRLNNMRCTKCGFIENFKKAIMRSIRDFHTLFPDEKIKVKTIMEWTNNCVSKHRIRTVLSDHCFLVSKGKNSYYLFNEEVTKL